ncbi:MAG TPA: universal stress protein [Gammaproteobacteria bacterium]|nr:universal stress protein [Gammaproteobacteria bacterium]
MADQKMERVLVAIKPWERGLPLESQHAAQLAQALGADLMLLSAVFDARIASRADRGNATALAARARMIETERVELERLAHSLRDWGATVATRVVFQAPAYQAVLDVAREWRADLLVVGVHERGLRLRTRLTDTDWQLMQLTPCPLLLVKDPAFDGYPTIIAAVDPAHPHAAESGVDRAVLEIAKTLASACDSELRAVHALPQPERSPLRPVEVAPGVYCDTDAIEELHRCAVDELLANYAVPPERVDLVQGAPAEVIAQTVDERRAALVVIGALRRSRLEQAILGSTAEAVAMDVPCDVLLVPPPGAAPVAARSRGRKARDTARTAKPPRRPASSAAPDGRPARR